MKMKRFTGLVAVVLAVASAIASAAETDGVTLRDVAAVRAAVYDTVPRSERFELEVTVTYGADSLFGAFSVTDGRDAITVTAGELPLAEPLAPGDLIRITGHVVTSDLGYNNADVTAVERLGRVEPPAPEPVEISALSSSDFSDRVVRLEGSVFDAFLDDTDRRFVFLVLVGDDGATVYVPVYADGVPADRFTRLIDARVAVTALAIRDRKGSTKRKLAVNFSHILPDAVTELLPPPANPFDVPELAGSIRDILEPRPGVSRRRKTRGEVVAVWGGRNVLLRRAGDEFTKVVLLDKSALPRPGAFVEAVGAPDTDLYHLNLSRARVRVVTGTPQADSVREVRMRDLFADEDGRPQIDTKYHGYPVRVTGVVAERTEADRRAGRFDIVDGGFRLTVDAGAAPDDFVGVEPGSRVEVTGVCIVEIENWRPQVPFPKVEGCLLAVRDLADVRVLSRPPWWTTGRLLAALGALLVILVASLVWNRILNRIADRRGHQLLREQIGRAKANLKAEERTRLAVELHDSLAQSLSGAVMEIEASRELRGDAPAAMMSHLDIAEKTLKSCQSELRNCLWDLRSRALEGKRMDDAILLTLRPHVQGTTVLVRFAVPRTRLSDNTAHALLCIIRELTLNAIRHGGAKTVRIAGSLDGNDLLFSVKDDGCGFDPAARPGVLQGHFGLAGIGERVEQFDGELDVQSSPGHGAQIRGRITLPDKDEPGLL